MDTAYILAKMLQTKMSLEENGEKLQIFQDNSILSFTTAGHIVDDYRLVKSLSQNRFNYTFSIGTAKPNNSTSVSFSTVSLEEFLEGVTSSGFIKEIFLKGTSVYSTMIVPEDLVLYGMLQMMLLYNWDFIWSTSLSIVGYENYESAKVTINGTVYNVILFHKNHLMKHLRLSEKS